MTLRGGAGTCATSDPARYMARGAPQPWASTCARCSTCKKQGAVTFDYGNNIRAEAQKAGVEDAFDFPGFVPAYIRPLFCEGKGPFRWAVLSGDPADLARDRRRRAAHVPRGPGPRPLDHAGARAGALPGPARAHLLARLRRAREDGPRLQRARAHAARCQAPIVIGRDHLDAGSVASPNRETEAMRDGSDAVADWPILNALLNAVARRDLGLGPPRRRRRHGLLDPRRHGGGRGRHARRRRAGCSACSPPTRARASCATPTPATSARSRWRASAACTIPHARSPR